MDDRKTVTQTPPGTGAGTGPIEPSPREIAAPTAKIIAPTSTPAAGDLKIGQMLGGYEVIRLLGRGGMGAVYLAKQVKLDRLVVVKVIAPHLASQPEIVGRLHREAKAAAKIGSDHVVQVFDCDTVDGVPFIVMEYVEGTSVDDHLEKSYRLSPGEATRIVLQAAKGLKAAHDVGVLHRDMKPANLLMAKDGRVKVADFGLAKLAPAGSDPGVQKSASLSMEGQILGTPAYMAPEQADAKPLDARADLYALGVTYYELLTGELPFKGTTPLKMIAAMLNDPVTPPRMVIPTIPEAVENAVLTLMARDRFARPANADAAIKLLEGLSSGSVNPSMVSGIVEPSVSAPPAPPAAQAQPQPQPRPSSSVSLPALGTPSGRVVVAGRPGRSQTDWALLLAVGGSVLVLGAVMYGMTNRKPPAPRPIEAAPPAKPSTEFTPSSDPPIFTNDPEELRREEQKARERRALERAGIEGREELEHRNRDRAASQQKTMSGGKPTYSSEGSSYGQSSYGRVDEATYRAGLTSFAARAKALHDREFALHERETDIKRSKNPSQYALQDIQRQLDGIRKERAQLETERQDLHRRYEQSKR